MVATLTLNKKFLVSAAVVLLFATLLFTMFQATEERKIRENPEALSAHITSQLIKQNENLRTSFEIRDNPKKATKDYLAYITAVQNLCSELKSRTDNTTGLNPEIAKRIKNSRELCAEFSKLASESEKIYKPVEPLLTSPTDVKRYQTFGPIQNRIRSQDKRDTQLALKQLPNAPKEEEFPTAVVSLLEQLDSSMSKSQGLKYIPELQRFQNQLLAERQRFWEAYADLSALDSALQTQLKKYCQNLDQSKYKLDACKY
jgi:hypothetical protein